MLGRIALRIAAVEALKGKTLVEDNVLDSEIGALDVGADNSIRTDQEKPFLSVYVEGSKYEVASGVTRPLNRSGATDFMIEIGITAAMTETDPDTDESKVIGIGIPVTDPALEFYLDVVGRQVVNTLTDPTNAWAEIWRGLSSGILKIERKRTSDAASGVRIAAHQLVVTVDLLPDPVFGEPIAPKSIWAKLFAQMEATNHPFLPTLQSLVGSPSGLMHEAQRRRFGMTLDEARALLDIAVQPAEATEPNIAEVTVTREA